MGVGDVAVHRRVTDDALVFNTATFLSLAETPVLRGFLVEADEGTRTLDLLHGNPMGVGNEVVLGLFIRDSACVASLLMV